jgi:hypothetical protein
MMTHKIHASQSEDYNFDGLIACVERVVMSLNGRRR